MIPETREEAFEVLELSEGVSPEETKKAYHKLALKWHPDKWSGKSQEEQNIATENFKGISVAYEILTGKITEELIKEQPNDDWHNDHYEKWRKELYRGFKKSTHGSHLSEEEVDLFDALDKGDLAQTKVLLKKVQNINAQTKPFDFLTRNSILHYIVENACNNPKSGWRELLEEVLSKYSANNSIPAHVCSQPIYINVNIVTDCVGSPLNLACELGNFDVAKVLLEHGAEPDVRILYCVLMNNKNDFAKVLFAHSAKIDADPEVEKLIIDGITEYSQSTVEMFLPHLSDGQKSKMLQVIAYSDCEETDHDIEIAKLLLKAGADPEFCGEIEKGESNASASYWAKVKGKSKLAKLFDEHKRNTLHTTTSKISTNGISNPKQDPKPHIADNTKYNSPQKQSSGRRWAVIVPALLFGAVGATLAAMGIIPEIAAIGIVATAVLSGIAGALVGGIAGYLVDAAINQCCGNQQCAASS